MRKKWTGFILVMVFAFLLLPFSPVAEAATIRYTYRFVSGVGWRLVSTQAIQPERAGCFIYRVQPGDTLSGISARYRTTALELQRLNSLPGERIYTGQLLLIPLPSLQAPQAAPAPQPAAGLTQAEQQMLELVNKERAAYGLRPLQADQELTRLARLKSQDMISLGYFAHQSPTYGSPFDMMRSAGVTYRLAGENLAHAPSVERAHTALMNSPGHRANILNPNYTHIGIGALGGAPYGMMFTQLFVGR